MLKLIFWGIVGYIVYRYFQMREAAKENRQRQFEEQQRQQHFSAPGPEKMKSEGEFIDYEELK